MSMRSIRRATPRLLRLQPTHRLASSFRPSPSPVKLPAEEQAEFERLQRDASVSSAFQPEQLEKDASSDKTVKTEDVNPGLFRGAKPEFDGEVNPKTGEVGGPKNDPLRWKGDWSYNGRVTDF